MLDAILSFIILLLLTLTGIVALTFNAILYFLDIIWQYIYFLGPTFIFLVFYGNLRKPGAPPGPFQFPFFGSAWAMGLRATKLHISLSLLSKSWGPIYSLRVGTLPIVVITDPELMKEAIPNIKSAPFLRFQSKTIQKMDEGKSLVFAAHRNHWQFLRALSMGITRNMPNGTPIQKMISNEILHSLARCDYFAHSKEHVHFNPLFVVFTRNIIFQLIFSTRWDYKLIETDKKIASYHNAMENALKEHFAANDFFPLLDIRGRKSVKNNQNLLEVYLKELTKEREEDRLLPKEISNARDLLDIFILEKNRSNSELDEVSFYGTLRSFLYAGTFTVSDALDWLILFLCKYPEVQEKAYNEISTKLQKKQPTMNDQADLPYLDAVIKEVMRVRPPAPLALPHFTDAECTIGGYKIQKGSCIMLNLFGIGNSDRYFENSEKFDPERWIHNPAQIDKLLYFGVGPNACLGMPIAKQELFLTAAALVQRYQFTISPLSPKIDDTGNFKVTYNPSHWNTLISLR